MLLVVLVIMMVMVDRLGIGWQVEGSKQIREAIYVNLDYRQRKATLVNSSSGSSSK